MPKSVELEKRIARLELEVRNLAEENAAVKKRIIAMQAQLDHVAARRSDRL